MITNATEQELQSALKVVNKNYGNNIIFNRLEQKGKKMAFTLKIKSSKQSKGTRKSFQGRRLACACWHVHGEFFDALFGVNKDAFVDSSGVGKITKDNDLNWTDRNIGSIMQPMLFSEACFCISKVCKIKKVE